MCRSFHHVGEEAYSLNVVSLRASVPPPDFTNFKLVRSMGSRTGKSGIIFLTVEMVEHYHVVV